MRHILRELGAGYYHPETNLATGWLRATRALGPFNFHFSLW